MDKESLEPRSAYEIAADDLCAVMALNEAEYAAIRFEYGLAPNVFPMGWHREFVTAVYSLRETGQPVHDSLIKERCPKAPLSWILQVLTLYDDTRTGMVCRENARLVKKEGLRLGAMRLLDIAKEQMESGKDRETVTNRLVELLQSIGRDGTIENVRASEHADKNRAEREKIRDMQAPLTGMTWWDNQSIRYEEGQIWWIAGAYKSRKTSLALNLALAAAMNGLSVGILSKEMGQDRIQSIMEAMLAVGHLQSQDLIGKSYEQNGYSWQFDKISGKWIRNVGANWKMGHPARVRALQWAFDTYKALPMRVYDSTPEHGGLSDFASIQRVIGRDCQHDKGKLFFVDYFQLFAGSSYEEIANLAKSLQSFAQKKKITLVMLAQRNEDSIKGGGESYSAGIKGGGDASATADYLFITRYKEDSQDENAENFLNLQIKHAREDAAGGTLRQNMPIHPQSGLLFDFDWIRRI